MTGHRARIANFRLSLHEVFPLFRSRYVERNRPTGAVSAHIPPTAAPMPLDLGVLSSGVAIYAEAVTAHVRIIGTNLPGTSCGPAPTISGTYSNIHVGVQKGNTAIGLVCADAVEARFEVDVTVRGNRFGGPFVHGRGAERFIYLSWGEVIDGSFLMFRRAKLQLDGLDAAACDGHTIEAHVQLSDECGWPLCASVRPPRITWHIL